MLFNNKPISDFNAQIKSNDKLGYNSAFTNYELQLSGRKREKASDNLSNFTLNPLNKQVSSHSQGLKEISKQVVNIIKSSKVTTYKDISDKIVDSTNLVFANDAKNIRRRIYDALNVLKAINIFNHSDSKKIVWTGKEINDSFTELNTEIDNQKGKNKLKQEEINKLRQQNDIYSDLIKRNKSKADCNLPLNEKLFTPFLIVNYPKRHVSHSVIVGSVNKKRLCIGNSVKVKIEGDYDVIRKIYTKNNI